MIPAKYINNINNFCQVNPEYQVLLACLVFRSADVFTTKALIAKGKKMTMSCRWPQNKRHATEQGQPLQVILWMDASNGLPQLSYTVEQRDVDSLLSGVRNEDVFSQLTEVGARADLLKYEVLTFFWLNK